MASERKPVRLVTYYQRRISMSTVETAVRIQELMDEGASLTEALAKVLGNTKPGIVDRIEWISSLESIGEVRTARKIAFAKKSKAKEGSEQRAKYSREAAAGAKRLNELLTEVDKAEHPWKKSIELGEFPSGATQLYIRELDEEVQGLMEGTGDISKSKLKDLLNKYPTSVPARVFSDLAEHEDVLQVYKERTDHLDQRVLGINKKLNCIADLTKTNEPEGK
jgi:hypothetical protein